MNEIQLFNINDITVLLYGFMALLLTGLLVCQRLQLKNLLLAVFFFLCFLYSVDTLVYWNRTINAVLSAVSTNLFFLFGFSLLLQGPLLYWFTQTATRNQFVFSWKDMVHLLPTLVYPFYMYFVYYGFNDRYKLQLAHDWQAVVSNPWFESLIWAQRLSVFIYSLLCVRMLYGYITYIKRNDISLNKVDTQWLKLLLLGFLGVNAWMMLQLVESRLLHLGLASPLGIAESYLRFAVMSLLVFYLLRNSNGFTDIQAEYAIGEVATGFSQQDDVLARLISFMDNEKPYLEPHITLERLAARLQVPPKLLSSTINRRLHKNFFEMIRHYRVKEAKAQLIDARHRDHSIGDVMKACGFNSKSVFNQAFKQAVGVTPRRYRQQHSGP